MAKKNLARTVIEGGRSQPWKDFVAQAQRTERQQVRALCHAQLFKVEDEADIDVRRLKPSYRYLIDDKFNDKFGAMNSWVYAQVGRSWDAIYSELRQKFDVRTTAGCHILFDHLLGRVCRLSVDSCPEKHKHCDLFLDTQGRLSRQDTGYWRRHGR